MTLLLLQVRWRADVRGWVSGSVRDSMAEVDYARLYNCTARLIDQDPFVNVSSVWALNRSQVTSVLFNENF